MKLERKSDGFVICAGNQVGEWSDWYPEYIFNNIQTLSGNYYPQPWGVELEMQDLTLIFANHYAYKQSHFRQLVRAHRRNQTLTFTDFYGEAFDVRVFDVLGKDANKRWTEVRTKNIRKVEVTLVKLGYNA